MDRAAMVEETGTVIRVAGGTAWVQVERGTTCSHCSARSGCGVGLLGQVFSRRPPPLEVDNRLGAVPGDRVVVGVAGSGLVQGALWMYLLPLVLLVVFAAAGQELAASGLAPGSETPAIAGGLFGLGLGLWAARRASRRLGRRPGLRPVMLRRLSAAGLVVAGGPTG